METLVLEAQKRTTKVKQTRAAGGIPAVLYGHGIASTSLTLPSAAFEQVYRKAGGSTLLDVMVDAQPHKALIQDIQHDPVTGKVLHVDLYEVRMTEKMEAKIALHFVGEAPAVKGLGGLLVKNLNQVNVKCLPQDLVPAIEINIAGLATFGQSIYVKDIPVPPGITLLEKPEEPVVTVMRPKTEEELQKELAEETPKEVADVVKVQEKGKKEEEEGEAGAAGVGAGEKSAKGGAAPAGKAEKPAKGGDKK